MGNNFTKTNTEFNTDVINDTVNSIITKGLNTAQSSLSTVQVNSIKIKGDNRCGITQSNTGNSSLLLYAKAKQDGNFSITAEQSTAITNSVQKQISQQNQNLNLFQNNTVEDSVKISNTIKNTISSTIDTQISNAVSSFSSTDQGNIIEIDGSNICGPDQILNQSNASDTSSVVTGIVDQTVKAVIKTGQVNDILNNYKLQVTQSNIGIPLNLTIVLVVLIIVAGIIIGAPVVAGPVILSTFSKTIFPIIYIISILVSLIFVFAKNWIVVVISFALSILFGLVWSFTSNV
jgi:hypothetical protein